MALDPALLKRIHNNDPGLISLNLREKNLDENDVNELSQGLKDNRTLSSLDLSYNSIGDDGATVLANALKKNHALTRLELWCSSIGDAGATALAGALKHNRTLTGLYFSFNTIGDTGAIALANALKTNRAITPLELVGNSIGDTGAIALADALKENRNLIELDLGSNPITDEGEQALKDVLLKSKNIVFTRPDPKEMYAHCEENKVIAGKLIEKIQSNPVSLTPDDRQEIQDRIPAILYVGRADFALTNEKVLEMLEDIGIKPSFGPVTQKVNAAREAQRRAALEDPSQGI